MVNAQLIALEKHSRIIIPSDKKGIDRALQLYYCNEPFMRFNVNGGDFEKILRETIKELNLDDFNRKYLEGTSRLKGSGWNVVGLGIPLFYGDKIELHDAFSWVRVNEEHLRDISFYLPQGIELIKSNDKPFIQLI